MGRIRPFVREDIPPVVALYEDVRRGGDRSLSRPLAAYLEQIFRMGRNGPPRPAPA